MEQMTNDTPYWKERLSAHDTISRQAAIDALAEYIHNVDKVMGTGRLTAYDCKDAAASVFEELPSAQPERKKGKWMEENTRSASYIFKCSCCGKNAYFVHGKGRGRNCENRYCGYDYCPNCGADMRENNS